MDSAVAAASPVVETLHAELLRRRRRAAGVYLAAGRTILGGACACRRRRSRPDRSDRGRWAPGRSASTPTPETQLARLSLATASSTCRWSTSRRAATADALAPRTSSASGSSTTYCADTCRSYPRARRAMAEMAVPACPAGGSSSTSGCSTAVRRTRAAASAHGARRPRPGGAGKLGADASPSLIDAVDAVRRPATRRNGEVVAQRWNRGSAAGELGGAGRDSGYTFTPTHLADDSPQTPDWRRRARPAVTVPAAGGRPPARGRIFWRLYRVAPA